jgi:uncharacterized protein
MPTALITGASTGIGREFAYLCAQDGYDLVLNARSKPPLAALAADIKQTTGRTVHVFARDLSDPEAARVLYNDVVCTGIQVDTLINNAGFGSVGFFWEMKEAEQMQMLHLNIGALTQLSHLFLPDFIERRGGAILNVASVAAFQPIPLMSVYAATKAYVVSFSEALHNEARGYGVKVTCLCPGLTKTEFGTRSKMNQKMFESSMAMDARTVAKIGWTGLNAGKPLVTAGRLNALMAFLTRFSPMQFNASIARRMQGKV